MKKTALALALLMALAGAAFAASSGSLTDREKQCIRGCCEAAGGVYEYEHNGCESPESGITECADSCRESGGGPCPFATLMLPAFAVAALSMKKGGM